MPTNKSAHKKTSKKSPVKKWSKRVNETSDAMDLEANIFTSNSAKKIAASLKASAEKSNRKKTGPFQSAISMLNFYENRGGENLTDAKRKVLENAKKELRKLYGREDGN